MTIDRRNFRRKANWQLCCQIDEIINTLFTAPTRTRQDSLICLVHVDGVNELYTVSQKNCAKLFSSELRHVSTNFDNFLQKDGKEAEIMRDAFIFHLT